MRPRDIRLAALAAIAVPALVSAQSRAADWPVYGGNTDNTHYTTLGQITPANVARLKVAWTYQTIEGLACDFDARIAAGSQSVRQIKQTIARLIDARRTPGRRADAPRSR